MLTEEILIPDSARKQVILCIIQDNLNILTHIKIQPIWRVSRCVNFKFLLKYS